MDASPDEFSFMNFWRSHDQCTHPGTQSCMKKISDISGQLTTCVSLYPHFPCKAYFDSLVFSKSNITSTLFDKSNTDSHCLWSDKYMPIKCAHFLPNCPNLATLHHWLVSWKRHFSGKSESKSLPPHRYKPTPTKKIHKSHSRASSSEDDFETDYQPPPVKQRRSVIKPIDQPSKSNSSFQPLFYTAGSESTNGAVGRHDNQSERLEPTNHSALNGGNFVDNDDEDDNVQSWRSQTCLLVGPSGCGKTALVHALASDLNFKVFELNPSTRRSGKDLQSQFQTVFNSHHVATDHVTSSSSSKLSDPNASDTISSPAGRKALRKIQSKSSNGSSKASAKAAFFLPRTSTKRPRDLSTTPTDCNRSKPSEDVGLNLSCNSLILLDEVDVLFESDKGFWSSVSSLLQLARRPIAMTASDASIIDSIPFEVNLFHLHRPSPSLAIPYLHLVCLAEGYSTDRSTIESAIIDRSSPMDDITSSQLASTFAISTSDSRDGVDLRQALNQLQWMSASGKLEGHGQSDVSSLASPVISNQSITSFEKLSTEYTGIVRFYRREKPTISHQPMTENGLSTLFDDENSDANVVETTNLSEVETIKQSNCRTLSSSSLSTWFLSLPSSKSLSDFLNHLSLNDVGVVGLERANLQASHPDTTILNPPSSKRLIVDLVMPDRVACSPGLDPTNSNTLMQSYWPTLLLADVSRMQSNRSEKPKLLSQSLQQSLVVTKPNPIADQYVSTTRCISELLRCGVGLKLVNATNGSFQQAAQSSYYYRRRMACDYLPWLRFLAWGEALNQLTCAKRRYCHYFNRISLHLDESIRSQLSELAFGRLRAEPS